MITAPMRAALVYVQQVRVVRAWPEQIKDGTIRRLRREGYLRTDVTSWNVHPAGGMRWHHIKDRLTDKGRDALA